MSDTSIRRRVAIIGGGAAGYFAAIRCAEINPETEVILYEATHRPLLKVLISGGGRCNVTHNCFEPSDLVKGYPRGHEELRGPFSKFQAADTVEWFAQRGVTLKAEPDGRMFPVSDQSSTIADCLLHAAEHAGVITHLGVRIKELRRVEDGRFEIHFKDGSVQLFDSILLATGSTPSGYKMAVALGHTITPLAPSLFTFTVTDRRLSGLPGISVSKTFLELEVAGKHCFEQAGPLLITDWGLSGPAVLKLSAWAARELLHANYQAKLIIRWLPGMNAEQCAEAIQAHRRGSPTKVISKDNFLPLPRRLWASLVAYAGINEELTWAHMTHDQIRQLSVELSGGEYRVIGKGEFKEEFVTCGGVNLKEVDLRTMQSKICPGLFFAGEILDIDGITGGYNFQSAWTTGWIAGRNMG